MQEFISLHNHILQNPKLKEQIGKTLYNVGINLVTSQNDDITLKEIVLMKLIFIFPEDSNLYFMLGELFKNVNFEKALIWYKICYQIDNTHKNNIIQLIKTLFENGLTNQVFEIVKFDSSEKNIFNKLLDDDVFLGLYARCNFQQLYYKNGVQYLLKLIKQNSSKTCNTQEEKRVKWTNYHDLGYIYCAMGDIENSLQYTNKAIDFANKFNLNTQDKLLSFSNSLCYSEYYYANNETLFKQYLKINDYLPNKPSFNFELRKQNIKSSSLENINRKIKIGYLSSDFTYHAVANFLVPILKNHDKNKFDIILYANLKEFNSPIFTSLNLRYYIINHLNDLEAANLINKHEIDILFDLNGHTVNNRLGVFTYNPAPLQVTYLGFPNTTGLKSIKYRIVDSTTDPVSSSQKYSETLIRLPKCFLLYKSINQETPIIPKKTNNQVILAAINKENKNSKNALETWKIILKECPKTKLLIKLETFDNNEERMQYYSEKLGVDEKRLIIVNKLDNNEYNNLFSKIDVLLDTFPYSGTTTTCNALFNSIPVVSLYNENSHAHNVSCSLLVNSGLSELVANSQEEYVNIVKTLVSNTSKIDEYKKNIKEKFKNLMEPKQFMETYEEVLVNLYKTIS